MAKGRILVGVLLLSGLGAAKTPFSITVDGLRNSNPAATFDHGFVAAWGLENQDSLTLYGVDGHRMFDVSSVMLPDGTKSDAPISVAVDSDATSAIVYWFEQGTRAGIAILDKAGNQLRVIETQPYRPAQVCFAPDHSIWTLGDQWKINLRPAEDFMVFHHYSRNGKLLGSFVPRSALPIWEGMGVDQVVAPFVGGWRLRASQDRIGAAFYLGAGKHAWVELDLQGALLGQWIYSNSPGESIMPAAFTSDGQLFGTHSIEGNRVGISVFDKPTSSWRPATWLPNGSLRGADGMRLVYQNGDQLRWINRFDINVQSASSKRP
jgi:hypothetical protein